MGKEEREKKSHTSSQAMEREFHRQVGRQAGRKVESERKRVRHAACTKRERSACRRSYAIVSISSFLLLSFSSPPPSKDMLLYTGTEY